MSSRREFIAKGLSLLGAGIATQAMGAPASPAPDLYLPPSGKSSRNDLFLPGSSAPGISGSPELLKAVDALLAVEEGSGAPKIRILFEFSCPRSPELYRRIRPMLGSARFEWIPIPNLNPQADAPAVKLFRPHVSSAMLADVFAGKKTKDGDLVAAERQGQSFTMVVRPILFRETNRNFTTPTLIYAGRDQDTKIIRGEPDLGTLRAIIASAN